MEEVEIIGLVREYDDKYGVFLVKSRLEDRELSCIAASRSLAEAGGHNMDAIRQIER